MRTAPHCTCSVFRHTLAHTPSGVCQARFKQLLRGTWWIRAIFLDTRFCYGPGLQTKPLAFTLTPRQKVFSLLRKR